MQNSHLYTLLFISASSMLSSYVHASIDSTVYKSDSHYHYRIPAIVADTSKKTTHLYAFSEKRHRGTNLKCGDSGEIDIVMRSSKDNGDSWSPETTIVGEIPISKEIDQFQAYTNPTVLYTKNSLHLVFNTHLNFQCASGKKVSSSQRMKVGDRKFWHSYSSDGGKTWSTPKQILIPTNLRDRVDMVGPGNGIMTKDGRLIFPASGKNLISNDYGKTWSISKIQHGGSEATIVELCNGKLLRNDRPGFTHTKFLSGKKEPNNRVYSIGNNKGNNWSDWKAMAGIDMPTNPWVEASLIKLDCTPENQTILAFSTPNHIKSREKMSIFISKDSGINWQKQSQLTEGKSDYSSLVKLSNNTLGILYEEGFGAISIKYSSIDLN